MAIYLFFEKPGVRALEPPLQRFNRAIRNLQRATSLSRINRIRVEMRFFKEELEA